MNKAFASLERAVAQPKDEFSRDSAIHRFEFTFELCWRALQKWIEADRPLDDTSIKGILRTAVAQGLISELDQWFEFQRARNLSSHTYNEVTAEEVYRIALKLPPYATALLGKLV